MDYPKLKKDTTSTTLFGRKFTNPYKFTKGNYKEAKDWLLAEKELTRMYLRQCRFKDRIKENIRHYAGVNNARLTKEGDYYFRFGLDPDNYGSLALFSRKKLDEDDKKLLSFASLPKEKNERVDVDDFILSNDSRYLALTCSKNSKEAEDIYVFSIEDDSLTRDHIRGFAYSDMIDQSNGLAWRKDGFYYVRRGNVKNLAPIDLKTYDFQNPDKADQAQYLYYHKLGTDQLDDQAIFVRKSNPQAYLNVFVSSDERFLVIIEWNSITDKTNVFVDDFEDQVDGLKLALKGIDGYIRFIESLDNRLLILTDAENDNLWLGYLDPNRPNELAKALNVDETGSLLKNAYVAGENIITIYTAEDKQIMLVFDLSGNLQYRVMVEDGMSFTRFMGSKGDPELFVFIESKVQGRVCGVFDLNQNKFVAKFGAKNDRFNEDDYLYEYHTFISSDSVEIPVMTIRHKKRFNPDGDNPMLLNVYGGYGLTMEPYFDASVVYLLECGGVYAQAFIRGGGELGPSWHKQGSGLNKQNTVNDLIEAAEYLIENKYTTANKLAITGQSHGGFVVASAMAKRPDLFRVVIPRAGIYDLLDLQFHGSEFGAPIDSTAFFNKIDLSAYHNLGKAMYPSVLFITSLNDQRVSPTQAFKMTARLQEESISDNPVLLYAFGSGHYQAYSWSTWLQLRTSMLSFMFNEMGIKPRF